MVILFLLLGHAKNSVFAKDFDAAMANMEAYLFDNFYDHFNLIKPVLKKWWIVLKPGFEFQGYESANIMKSLSIF
jgi:hypothetical protein